MSTEKSVTLVEMTVDIYRATQFEKFRSGDSYSGTSRIKDEWLRVGDADSDFTIIANDDFESGLGAILSMDSETSDGHSGFVYTATGAMTNMSILAHVAAGEETNNIAIMARTNTEDGSCYVLTLAAGESDDTTGQITVSVQADGLTGANEIIDSDTLDFNPLADHVWVLFEVVNLGPGPFADVLLRAKVWNGTISDEPAEFMFSATDTDSMLEDDGGTIEGYGGIKLEIDPDTESDTGSIAVSFFRVKCVFGTNEEVIRLAKPTSILPLDETFVPNIIDINENAPKISLGEGNFVGERATVNIICRDTKWADNGEFYDNGTFWGKFRARELFKSGNPLKIYRGFVDQTFSDFKSYLYFLDKFEGPTNDGTFTITGQDLLKFIENDRAQAPALSNGSLSADLDDTTTSFTVLPTGVGDEEYPGDGFICLGGKEICSFTRSGDNFTVVRGINTAADDHSEGDRVQWVLDFDDESAPFIAYILLTFFADIDEVYIPLSEWFGEGDAYLNTSYTRLITEPTSVEKLLSELAENTGTAFWWDPESELIRFKVLRPIPTNAKIIDEDVIMLDSLSVKEQHEKRLSQVWVHYAQRDPADRGDNEDNYAASLALVDLEAEERYGGQRIKNMSAPWVNNQTSADRLTQIWLSRFTKPPRAFKFNIFEGTDITLGGAYRLRWRQNQTEFGGINELGAPIQITKVLPLEGMSEIEAEEMFFTSIVEVDTTNRVLTFDNNEVDVVLPIYHDLIYPPLTDQDVIDGVNLTVIINSWVQISASSAGALAFNFGSWPTGLPITVYNFGRIQGGGGNGGDDVHPDGYPGGPAFFTRQAITLNNFGQIWSGGGGGGRAAVTSTIPPTKVGGGGGAGNIPGFGSGANPSNAETIGKNGSTEAGGAGGTLIGGFFTLQGGNGGGPGSNGTGGTVSAAGGTSNTSGGAAGTAIDGLSFITLNNTGSILGPQIN